MLGVDLGHPEEDPREDDGVEDPDEGDAQHDPQRHEADLPRPRYQSARRTHSELPLSHQCIIFSILSIPVEFEGEKDELEDVDGAEELELEGAVVPHAPYAHRHRHHADEDLWMKISIGRTGRSEEISEDVFFSGP